MSSYKIALVEGVTHTVVYHFVVSAFVFDNNSLAEIVNEVHIPII